jgi:hypothetical protein
MERDAVIPWKVTWYPWQRRPSGAQGRSERVWRPEYLLSPTWVRTPDRPARPVDSRYTGQRTKPQRTIKIASLGHPRNFFPFVSLAALDVITQIGGRQTHVVEDALM